MLILIVLKSFDSSDIVQDLYLNEIRNYKAPVSTEKVDLPQKFSSPAPPPKPEVETVTAQAVEDAAIEEEAWPPLYNPIDDKSNFNQDFDFTTDKDDGSWYPKRSTVADYTHGHH